MSEDIGCVALMRGPFVYCFEGVDNDSDVQSLILEAEKIDQAKEEIMTDDIAEGNDIYHCSGSKA